MQPQNSDRCSKLVDQTTQSDIQGSLVHARIGEPHKTAQRKWRKRRRKRGSTTRPSSGGCTVPCANQGGTSRDGQRVKEKAVAVKINRNEDLRLQASGSVTVKRAQAFESKTNKKMGEYTTALPVNLSSESTHIRTHCGLHFCRQQQKKKRHEQRPKQNSVRQRKRRIPTKNHRVASRLMVLCTWRRSTIQQAHQGPALPRSRPQVSPPLQFCFRLAVSWH